MILSKAQNSKQEIQIIQAWKALEASSENNITLKHHGYQLSGSKFHFWNWTASSRHLTTWKILGDAEQNRRFVRPQMLLFGECKMATMAKKQASCSSKSRKPMLEGTTLLGMDLFSSIFQHDILNMLMLPILSMMLPITMNKFANRIVTTSRMLKIVAGQCKNTSEIVEETDVVYERLVWLIPVWSSTVIYKKATYLASITRSTHDSYPFDCLQFVATSLDNIANKPPRSKRYVLYLPRTSQRLRQLSNEPNIVADLARISHAHHFDFISFSHSDLTSDASIFKHAALIIGPHGGALANIILCSRKTAVIEIAALASAKDVRYCFSGIAFYKGLNYFMLPAETFGYRSKVMKVNRDRLVNQTELILRHIDMMEVHGTSLAAHSNTPGKLLTPDTRFSISNFCYGFASCMPSNPN